MLFKWKDILLFWLWCRYQVSFSLLMTLPTTQSAKPVIIIQHFNFHNSIFINIDIHHCGSAHNSARLLRLHVRRSEIQAPLLSLLQGCHDKADPMLSPQLLNKLGHVKKRISLLWCMTNKDFSYKFNLYTYIYNTINDIKMSTNGNQLQLRGNKIPVTSSLFTHSLMSHAYGTSHFTLITFTLCCNRKSVKSKHFLKKWKAWHKKNPISRE